MSLRWIDRQGVKLAKPRDDITITVAKWSRMWGWTIQKHEGLHLLARGTADTPRLAKQAAEIAWNDIEIGLAIVLTPTMPFHRRLSAERLIDLQRRRHN